MLSRGIFSSTIPPAEQARITKLVQGDLGAAKNETECFRALVAASTKAFQEVGIGKPRTLTTDRPVLPAERPRRRHPETVDGESKPRTYFSAVFRAGKSFQYAPLPRRITVSVASIENGVSGGCCRQDS